MSINKKYVNDLPRIKTQLKQMGETEFVKYYERIETLIGDHESINFIINTIKKYNKNGRNSKK